MSELKAIIDFVASRAKEEDYSKRLHAIWCVHVLYLWLNSPLTFFQVLHRHNE